MRAGFVLAVAGVMSCGLAAGWAQGATARLVLNSDVGDYIGGGKSFDVTYDTVQGSSIWADVGRLVAGVPAEVGFVLDDAVGGPSNSFALVDFGTLQLGIALVAGTYLDAERDAFASAGHPGLNVSFQNRGCNTLTGQFTVTEFLWSGSGTSCTIDRFVASFEQHDHGQVPALRGTFTYSAVPEPTTALMLCAGCGLVRLVGRGQIRRG